MAYVEFLNDISWAATHSYFNNKAVEKVVEYLWKGVKDCVNNQAKFQVVDINTFPQMLVYFTKSWDQRGKLDLSQFLNDCVTMCQIGVEARKRKIKEAPFHVLILLRNRIEEIENSQHIYIESTVANHAEELVQSFRL
ncbi:hypothetical protein AVEN_7564-1 [Araneus ventricosus]|uniref:Uncharacterized protein n=1 Tax=Araneus ventricosus TaxID=182803 RepID=A0A4Y2TFV3_ARAVE|nr:hypothetical protein AVEN_7564-1 [Araneus ventricosus]